MVPIATVERVAASRKGALNGRMAKPRVILGSPLEIAQIYNQVRIGKASHAGEIRGMCQLRHS